MISGDNTFCGYVLFMGAGVTDWVGGGVGDTLRRSDNLQSERDGQSM